MLAFAYLFILLDKEGVELWDKVRLSNKFSSQRHMPG